MSAPNFTEASLDWGKKYKQRHGDPHVFHTREEALEDFKNFIKTAEEVGTDEKSFHLYLEREEWIVYAESCKSNATGEHVGEFKVRKT
tara:strand:- start:276 stop:539 length:264 start_codon:yes stop_codon:yes gene_type:complete